MLTDRRSFLAGALAMTACAPIKMRPVEPITLTADPTGILDLPAGFSYNVISTALTPMRDGLRVPSRPDGMASFAGADGQVILVRNHENLAGQNQYSAFGDRLEHFGQIAPELIYDRGQGQTPGTGGTTTLVYDPATQSVVDEYLSLAGTELNCAGGPTPWGTWLSCEECFSDELVRFTGHFPREKTHGLVFEVDPKAGELRPPKPLPALGKFMHEACAVDPIEGYVYLTEDRKDGLFYRLVPNVPGDLEQGGRLQALGFDASVLVQTTNHDDTSVVAGDTYVGRWIDLDDVVTEADDLRIRGRRAGAITFARGEGLWFHDGDVFFTCTIGGSAKLGQIFRLHETLNGPELSLIAESEPDSILHHADNIACAPNGRIVVCEDRSSGCGLVIVGADGSLTRLAQHRATNSELAGACFSPDGETLFVNIQKPGLTLAINGPMAAVGLA